MDDTVRHSREAIERGSKSFALAARLFAPRHRDDVYMLYAWCRHCDDVIDGQESGFRDNAAPDRPPKQPQDGQPQDGQPQDEPPLDERLAAIRAKTERALRGAAEEAPFVALARVVAKHGIAPRYPLDLIEGFAMDARGARMRDLGDTLTYSYHVAGTVGLMMAKVMGASGEDTLDRACDLGIAFQLTNIARDIVDDAAAGRVYLPETWLAEAGVPREALADPVHRAALAGIADRLLAVADVHYDAALHGLPGLGFRAAWAVATARRVYRAIGTVVRRRGAAAWDRRAGTGTARKLAMVAGGLGDTLRSRPGLSPPAPSRAGLWTRPG